MSYNFAILANVVGLPLARVVETLREFGVVVPGGA